MRGYYVMKKKKKKRKEKEIGKEKEKERTKMKCRFKTLVALPCVVVQKPYNIKHSFTTKLVVSFCKLDVVTSWQYCFTTAIFSSN